MKKNSTFSKILTLLLVAFSITVSVKAQITYCDPTFSSGCTTWSNQTITLDSINWSLGSTDCSISDYTTMRTSLTKGVAYPMTVSNAAWCGVGVWIDYNLDGMFDSTENLYHLYSAAATQTYNFNITVPTSAPDGTFRMRVIAGWGTDCYGITSTNGYGGCGAYQYGNFDDFTVRVTHVSGAGINEAEGNNAISLTASPIPAENFLQVNINGKRDLNSILTLTDITGKSVLTKQVKNQTENMDVSSLAEGIYFLSYKDDKQTKVIKIKK